LVKGDASIEHHVTNKALDGLFMMIGDEEKKIRANPAATGSTILQKVFGSLLYGRSSERSDRKRAGCHWPTDVCVDAITEAPGLLLRADEVIR
jgi:hypothetical protein